MAKGARSDATPFAGLQEEIIIWEILVRLPPKALLRCRAVCRAWRRVLTTHAFLLAHHRHQPSFPLVSGFQHGGSRYQDILALDCRAADPTAQLIALARLSDATLDVHASCDGLLILSIQGMFFSICNPVTRECAALDAICGFNFLGFYPHSPTGEYRTLLYRQAELMYEHQIPGPRNAYYIFSLGSGLPRCIGSPSSERPRCSSTPVLVRGRLHWNPVQKPECPWSHDNRVRHHGRVIQGDACPHCSQLEELCVWGGYMSFQMDGTLGMFNCNDGKLERVDIWVLQDYEKEVWKLIYQVELLMSEIIQKFDGCQQWSAAAVSEKGSVVVLVHSDRWLLHVDTEGKLQGSFHRDGHDLMLYSEMIKQSLVYMPSLQSSMVMVSMVGHLLDGSNLRCCFFMANQNLTLDMTDVSDTSSL